jgi:hypothetical protein
VARCFSKFFVLCKGGSLLAFLNCGARVKGGEVVHVGMAHLLLDCMMVLIWSCASNYLYEGE